MVQAGREKLKELEDEEERQNSMLQEKEDIVNSQDDDPEGKSSEELQSLIDENEVGLCSKPAEISRFRRVYYN